MKLGCHCCSIRAEELLLTLAVECALKTSGYSGAGVRGCGDGS